VNNSRGKGIEWEVWCGSVGEGQGGEEQMLLTFLGFMISLKQEQRVESSRVGVVGLLRSCPARTRWMDGLIDLR